jgi:threonine dehydratase
MTNQVDLVRALHNKLFTNKLYRKLISATPKASNEGSVVFDEFSALQIMQKLAIAKGIITVGEEKMARLQDTLHTVILADGLGGSVEAAQRHVAIVREEIRLANYQSATASRAFNGLPPLSS